jgi:glycosyltransferase involved in cell wall biosynthesis
MAEYLPQTIESVLAQDYAHVEYIVMDGGSTDGTVEVLGSYKGRLRYLSGPDGGTADALNRGFGMARGSIYAWLNADDTYLPGAVSAAVRHLLEQPETAAVYGRGYWVDQHGKTLDPYPTQAFDRDALGQDCYICQPACFFRKSAFVEARGLDANLHYAFDYDLWIRMARRHVFRQVPEELATSRMHARNKTLAGRKALYAENFSVLKRYFGYIPFGWIYGRVCYRLDKRDQFFDPLRPSVLGYFLSLGLGVYHNWRHLGRYLKEWFQVMSCAGFVRLWRRSALGRAFERPSRS